MGSLVGRGYRSSGFASKRARDGVPLRLEHNQTRLRFGNGGGVAHRSADVRTSDAAHTRERTRTNLSVVTSLGICDERPPNRDVVRLDRQPITSIGVYLGSAVFTLTHQ
ncbi:hypothetical protein D8S78_16370 [Natrialba swarupiae]|nr:hypothetical protein [Natrialba swarupiae]